MAKNGFEGWTMQRLAAEHDKAKAAAQDAQNYLAAVSAAIKAALDSDAQAPARVAKAKVVKGSGKTDGRIRQPKKRRMKPDEMLKLVGQAVNAAKGMKTFTSSTLSDKAGIAEPAWASVWNRMKLKDMLEVVEDNGPHTTYKLA